MRVFTLALLVCTLCRGQTTDECKPSTLNIPGAQYPCVYPDHRATFRLVALNAQKLAALAALGTGAQISGDRDQRISVTIDAGKTSAPISPYLYGQFIEHIGDLVNRSVWAEMPMTGSSTTR
jgi:hypothetical protein